MIPPHPATSSPCGAALDIGWEAGSEAVSSPRYRAAAVGPDLGADRGRRHGMDCGGHRRATAFREHLHRAGVPEMSSEQMHAEEAYTYATAISVAVALAVSALAALAVTWYFSRRVQRSVAEVSSAAAAVADGHYDSRVSPPQLGDSFDSLARAFNQMASWLESVEATRRQLFGDLAHEIRTPVSVLKAYLEAVEDGVKDLHRETITMLRDQTRRLV
jgi:two-component system, OmpR family, sensor histidine kinase BaeS